MGCGIIVGNNDSGLGNECAVFYDSVTDTCFGTILHSLEEAESFQDWVFKRNKARKKDLRTLTHKEFVELLNKFREEKEDEKEIKTLSKRKEIC
jgi:hypothetical protein